METIAWYAQNEATDDEGFFLLDEPEKFWAAEKEILKEFGAPEVDRIEFITAEPEDRDEAIIEARVTPAFAEWARTDQNLSLVDED